MDRNERRSRRRKNTIIKVLISIGISLVILMSLSATVFVVFIPPHIYEILEIVFPLIILPYNVFVIFICFRWKFDPYLRERPDYKDVRVEDFSEFLGLAANFYSKKNYVKALSKSDITLLFRRQNEKTDAVAILKSNNLSENRQKLIQNLLYKDLQDNSREINKISLTLIIGITNVDQSAQKAISQKNKYFKKTKTTVFAVYSVKQKSVSVSNINYRVDSDEHIRIRLELFELLRSLEVENEK